MTPDEIKLALHEVLATGVSLNVSAYIALFLGWLVGGALGAFSGAFFTRRGETAAVKRDLETIKDNLRQTSSATEAIKAEITGDLWERQNRWSFKKDLYIRLLVGLGEAASAVRQLIYLDERLKDPSHQHLIEKTKQFMDKYFSELQRSMVEIRQAAFVAPLVCTEATERALGKLLESWLRAEATRGSRDYLEGCRTALSEAIESVTHAASEDLRLTPSEARR